MKLRHFLESTGEFKPGTFHTLEYLRCEKRAGLKALGFAYKVVYSFMWGVDYEARGGVKAYRATTGIGPNNPSRINETPTDIWGVTLNPKTNAIHFSVSLNGLKALNRVYSIEGQEVSKEEYYSRMETLGYAVPKPSASKTGVEFRMFNMEDILNIR